MGTVLVTGCDSGLGREFAVQYADAGYAVVATYHDLARRLPDHPGLRHRGLGVTDHGAFDRLAAEQRANRWTSWFPTPASAATCAGWARSTSAMSPACWR